jgi:chemotaxis signal transduction protein
VHVSEVSDPLPVWPIPLAPPCCIGAMHLHGSIIAAMDMVAFMGLPQCVKPEKMIVLRKEIAAMSFLVERVTRIASEQEAEIHDTPDGVLSSSTLVLPEGKVILIDVIKLLRTVEIMMSLSQNS